MHTQIVWIFGTAAAGKETFIKYCVQKKPQKLFAELGWSGRDIVPCKESMEWIAQYPSDPLGEQRQKLLQVVPELAESNPGAVILIKGQDLDLYARRLARLQDMTPYYEHQIVFLDGDPNQQFERWKAKPWFVQGFSVQTLKNHVCQQAFLLQKEPLAIRALYADSLETYVNVSFPPAMC